MFTDTLIDYKKCKEVLEPVFQKIIINENGGSYGNPPKSFYFDIEYEREAESIEPLDEDMRAKIPIKNPYCTNLDFHFEDLAKKVVGLFKSMYPELYIYENQINWFGTAEEYINLDYNKFN